MKRLVGPSFLLFLAVLAAYLANGRGIGSGDTLPARYVPWSLLRQQTFRLDEFPSLFDETARQTYPLLDGIPYYLQYWSGHYLSAYTPGSGVLALPAYALPVLLGAQADAGWAGRLEKLSAAIMTALSVLFLFKAVREVVSQGWALTIAMVYAFGTSSLSVSSQALWQHGPSQLFLAMLLYFLVKGLRDERYLAYAGFPMAAAVAMRSSDLLMVLPVAAWIVYAHRHRAWRLLLWALPPAAALAAYHVVYFGPPDHGLGHTTAPAWALFAQIPWSEGLPGVLVSPSRGLFVYSPVLLFSLAGMITVWQRGPALWRALSLGPPMVVLLISKWMTWWGGHSWGPRLLADADPILCFFLYPMTVHLDRRRLAKAFFVVLALWSIAAHALGAFLYDGRWDVLGTDQGSGHLWRWTESPLAFYGREALFSLSRFGWPSPGARPTSVSSPELLTASYQAGPAPAEVTSGERFVVSLAATNIGAAVWLAGAPADRGAVRLGWRWYRGDQEVAGGREGLTSDVLPGRSVRFRARIASPPLPGNYTLVLDLVSELVTWFSDHGQKPVRFAVKVLPLDITRLLSEPALAAESVPLVTLATDRPSYRRDETLRLTVGLEYPDRPRNFDGYLVLQGPDGQALFFDGHALPRRADASWPPWVKDLPLPARATGRFALPLTALAPGTYRWHVVLTGPGAHQAVARAAAGFKIEP